MAFLSPQGHGDVGGGVTLDDATAGGDTIFVDGTTLLRIQNTSGSNAYTVTITAKKCSHGFTHDLVMTIPAGANLIYNSPILSPDRFDSPAAIAYSGSAPATDLNVACVRMTDLQGVA